MMNITTVPVLGDNFSYIIACGNVAAAIDPGAAAPLQRIIEESNLTLLWVLCTHHHADHVGAAGELKKVFGSRIIGSVKSGMRGLDMSVDDGSVIEIGPVCIHVLATPGHTRDSICFYAPGSEHNAHGAVWTGDTLFGGGCGRLFECDAATMWNSLCKLMSLPSDTQVYFGHEYTEENLRFARALEPDNMIVKKRLAETEALLSAGRPTAPSTLALEKTTNPFLRADDEGLKAAIHAGSWDVVGTFAELRIRKNLF
jgi:hydroxyacylglutathione hydrolase